MVNENAATLLSAVIVAARDLSDYIKSGGEDLETLKGVNTYDLSNGRTSNSAEAQKIVNNKNKKYNEKRAALQSAIAACSSL